MWWALRQMEDFVSLVESSDNFGDMLQNRCSADNALQTGEHSATFLGTGGRGTRLWESGILALEEKYLSLCKSPRGSTGGSPVCRALGMPSQVLSAPFFFQSWPWGLETFYPASPDPVLAHTGSCCIWPAHTLVCKRITWRVCWTQKPESYSQRCGFRTSVVGPTSLHF